MNLFRSSPHCRRTSRARWYGFNWISAGARYGEGTARYGEGTARYGEGMARYGEGTKDATLENFTEQ